MFVANAIIKRVSLTTSDGYLGLALELNFGNSTGQAFGQYSLYSPHAPKDNSDNTKNYAGIFIWRCMEIAGVSDWKDMAGKPIRVRKQSEYDLIEAIGHIVEDKWFCPKEEFK